MSDVPLEALETTVRRAGPGRWLQIAAGVLVLAVVLLGWLLAGRRSSETPAGEATARSIAVLPFDNLSQDPENEYFSDGLTEDIITQLSKIGDLTVISRSSVMRYKNRERDLRGVGKDLGVATILEGSVRRAGDQLRINARLIDAQEAEKWLRQAMELEPDSPDGHLYLCEMYLNQGQYQEALEDARATLSRSPDDAWGLVLAGTAELLLGNLAEAEAHFEKKLDATAEYLNARAYLGYVLLETDRPKQAQQLLRDAREEARRAVDAGSESAWDRYLLAQVSAIEGNKEEASQWLEDAIESGWVHYRWSARDPLLSSLHGELRFHQAMVELEAKVSEQRRRVEEKATE